MKFVLVFFCLCVGHFYQCENGNVSGSTRIYSDEWAERRQHSVSPSTEGSDCVSSSFFFAVRRKQPRLWLFTVEDGSPSSLFTFSSAQRQHRGLRTDFWVAHWLKMTSLLSITCFVFGFFRRGRTEGFELTSEALISWKWRRLSQTANGSSINTPHPRTVLPCCVFLLFPVWLYFSMVFSLIFRCLSQIFLPKTNGISICHLVTSCVVEISSSLLLLLFRSLLPFACATVRQQTNKNKQTKPDRRTKARAKRKAEQQPFLCPAHPKLCPPKNYLKKPQKLNI